MTVAESSDRQGQESQSVSTSVATNLDGPEDTCEVASAMSRYSHMFVNFL